MSDFGRVHKQVGRYNSAAHESLRAVVRCMIVYYGEKAGRAQAHMMLNFFGTGVSSDLTPDQAYLCRRVLEYQLPN